MNSSAIDQILAPKPKARPRIYAYSIDDAAHAGLLKVGQTTRDVKQRVAEQLRTAAISNYRIELDEPAVRDDGSLISDFEVRGALIAKGFENPRLEWMRCTVADVQTVLAELQSGQRFTGSHHADFAMRAEQVRIPAKVNGDSGEREHPDFSTHHEAGFVPRVFTLGQVGPRPD